MIALLMGDPARGIGEHALEIPDLHSPIAAFEGRLGDQAGGIGDLALVVLDHVDLLRDPDLVVRDHEGSVLGVRS